VFHQGTVIPAPIKENDFPGGGQFFHVSLRIKLRLFSFGWGWQSDVPEYSRADTLHDSMDDSAFPSGVPTLENHDHLAATRFHPFLHLDKLGLQLAKVPFVFFVSESFCLLLVIRAILFSLVRHQHLHESISNHLFRAVVCDPLGPTDNWQFCQFFGTLSPKKIRWYAKQQSGL
jgi:hypothetical protein